MPEVRRPARSSVCLVVVPSGNGDCRDPLARDSTFALFLRAEGCALALPDSSIAISSLAGAPSEFSLHSIIEENDENVS